MDIETARKLMDIDTAKKLMESLAWMSLPIDEFGNKHLKDIDDAELKQKLFKLFTPILASHYDLLHMIRVLYPSLDPNGEGEDWYFSLRQKYQSDSFPAPKLTENQKNSAIKSGIAIAKQIKDGGNAT